MATLNSKRLQAALQKVRDVGRAEEPVIIDGLNLVLQSLPPAAYVAIIQETEELDGAEHLYAYQLGYVCRSIIEIEGVDLRDVDFVEDDVPVGVYLLSATVDNETKANKAREALKALGINATVSPPDGTEGTRTVLLERHEWVRKQVVTWSQEALAVAWRKYADVVVAGEERAKEKVEFRPPNETSEEKYRRLLTEAKSLEETIPSELVVKALDDIGYLLKSTPEELAEVARRTKEFAEEQAKQRVVAAPPEPEPEPEPAPPPRVSAPPADLMLNRVPMNQVAVAPTPVEAPVQRTPAAVPPQFQQALVQAPTTNESRSAKIAALEMEVDPGVTATPTVQPVRREVAELSKQGPSIDGKGVKNILDRPPAAGINPRFRVPPSRI
jgi:hypothetical protein